MTYGAEINRFLRMSDRYNADWLCIVLCSGKAQQVFAADDAKTFMCAAQSKSGYRGDGRLLFAITPGFEDLLRFQRRTFQQIVWLFTPTYQMRTYMHARLDCSDNIDRELLHDEVIAI